MTFLPQNNNLRWLAGWEATIVKYLYQQITVAQGAYILLAYFKALWLY